MRKSDSSMTVVAEGGEGDLGDGAIGARGARVGGGDGAERWDNVDGTRWSGRRVFALGLKFKIMISSLSSCMRMQATQMVMMLPRAPQTTIKIKKTSRDVQTTLSAKPFREAFVHNCQSA